MKAVKMINPTTIWFKKTKYENKRAITIANLVEDK